MPSQTRSSAALEDDNREFLRKSIATLMMEGIDNKLMLKGICSIAESPRVSFQDLENEIRLAMRMFRPRTLAELYGLCKLEEAKLGCCEMVLEMQWLSTLGYIHYNFHDLRMSFKYNNKLMTLTGTHNATIQWMEGRQSVKLLESDSVQCCTMSVCMYPSTLLQLKTDEKPANNSTLSRLSPLIQEFEDVFCNTY
uniref:Uncharacterized protein n=1 Tax=Tanacetum cinerariifolium TaxID=118510 RepID=A0A699HQQ2_TANCI|nr:hypothetical protein [Tanacetum cinerariifolium]